MKNVVSMKAKIFLVRDVKKGEAIGYGSTQKLKKDSVVAYVSAGYADGYQRNASNVGVPMREIQKPPKAMYKGKSVSGVGRISMDMSAFDVTGIKNVRVGDEVELFGDKYNVDKLAKATGTIGYEILTNAGGAAGRTKIVYV